MSGSSSGKSEWQQQCCCCSLLPLLLLLTLTTAAAAHSAAAAMVKVSSSRARVRVSSSRARVGHRANCNNSSAGQQQISLLSGGAPTELFGVVRWQFAQVAILGVIGQVVQTVSIALCIRLMDSNGWISDQFNTCDVYETEFQITKERARDWFCADKLNFESCLVIGNEQLCTVTWLRGRG